MPFRISRASNPSIQSEIFLIWISLQMDYDLDVAKDTSLERIIKEVQSTVAA